MRVSFRQGIVRCKFTPTVENPVIMFLQLSASGGAVDLIASMQDPTVITFAHGNADYLIEETRSVSLAWGGGVESIPGAATDINNSTLLGGVNQYLYWDIDLSTGALRRGWTSNALIVSPIAPVNAPDDLHWFDLTTQKMKVWRVTANGGHWLDKIRVFAGVLTSTNVIQPFTMSVVGTQVSINGNFKSGNILLGTNNKPLRQSDGSFATTETDLIIYQTSGQNIRFDMAVVYAQAAEEIPKLSLVCFKPDRRIGLASSVDLDNFISGLVVEDLHTNSVGQVVTNGAVRSDSWSWPSSAINKPLFCNTSGVVTLTPPALGVSQQIGYVFDVDAIYLNIFPPVRM